jgi:putative endonuclease
VTPNERSELRSQEIDSWYLYIAEAKTGRFYTGITNNPRKRIDLHNTGLGSKFAINQGPLVLVYVSSPYASKSDARKREVQIKNWSRIKKIKLIDGTWV